MKMKTHYENKDLVLKENCFITHNNCAIYGWYGLTYFEVEMNGSKLQDLYDLKDCINAMIKEIERLNK